MCLVAVRVFGLLEKTVFAQLFVLHYGFPNQLRPLFGFFCFLEIQRRELCLIEFGKMVAQMIKQHHAFFNAANRAPQTVFDVLGNGRQKRVGGKCVSGMTPETNALAVFER